MRELIITAALTAATSLTTSSPAMSAPIRECGDPDGRGGGRNLTTREWSCRQGRAVFRDWKRGRIGNRRPHWIRMTEKVTIRGNTTITDVRVLTKSGNVARFQFHGRASG